MHASPVGLEVTPMALLRADGAKQFALELAIGHPCRQRPAQAGSRRALPLTRAGLAPAGTRQLGLAYLTQIVGAHAACRCTGGYRKRRRVRIPFSHRQPTHRPVTAL